MKLPPIGFRLSYSMVAVFLNSVIHVQNQNTVNAQIFVVTIFCGLNFHGINFRG